MNWIDEVILQHKEYESPSSFWYWSALVTISAVIQDKVYLDKFLYKLYPNIYVMLHADSGLRKGAPVSMAKQLVTMVNNTKIISGRSSIQAIVKELGTAYTTAGGKVINKSAAFICSNELSASIVEDSAATNILTDLYDRSYNTDEWKSLLKMEAFSLKSPTVCMLTATNESHSDDFFVKKDIMGGYFARTFIIYDNKPNTINSLMFAPAVRTDYKALAEYLEELIKLEGEFVISNGTRKYFDEWYKDFRQSIIKQDIKDSTGTLNRFDDSVLKVAMLLSLAKEPTLEITQQTVEEAITKCEQLIGNVRRTTAGKGKNQWATEKAELIFELMKRNPHMITRQQLNKKYYLRASSSDWDDITQSLEAAGIINIERAGNQIVYVMPDEQVEEYRKHFEGKQK